MTLSGIISTKNSKSPGKSGGGLWSGNKVSQNNFKNTPEDLDTFCDIISDIILQNIARTFSRLLGCSHNYLIFYWL